jgi:hypothetical protein
LIDLDITTGGTAVSTDWPTWSDNVLVDNSENTEDCFVATDGSTASASNYTYIVPAGEIAIVPNGVCKMDGLEFVGSGGLNMGKNPAGNGVTAQTLPASLWTDGYPTSASVVLGNTATGHVGVEQR